MDPDPAFQVNSESEPNTERFQMRIQGFYVNKFKEIQLKNVELFFWSKIAITYPWAFIKDVQVTGEAFNPQKRTSSTCKRWNLLAVFYFSGSFLPSWIRIQSRSGSTTLDKSMHSKTSVADPGCLSRIPDPDFYPSRIPDPGSRIADPKTATKERGEKKFLSYLFMWPHISLNCKVF